MTENSEPNSAGKTHASSRNPALEGESGQYVEGDYGDAGVAGDDAASEKGEYPEGDYGTAGGRSDPPGPKKANTPPATTGRRARWVRNLPATEEGEYPEGDYGAAGAAPERGEADELKDELIDGQVNAPK